MAFDFKKEFKEFYLPKDRPEIVTVPEMNYIAVQGRGDPNQEGGAYQRAMQEGGGGIDYGNKDGFLWTSAIRLPDFVTPADFAWAVETASRKKKLDCSAAEFWTVEEGLCVQIMHLGSFDSEPESVAKMDAFLQEQGYAGDLSEARRHHEIYLTDARRVPPERWKTVIRHPIRKV